MSIGLPSVVESNQMKEVRPPKEESAKLARFPLGPKPTDAEHAAMNISIKGLTQRQRVNLFRLHRGLSAKGAVLENGSPVDDIGRAIRYVLESLG